MFKFRYGNPDIQDCFPSLVPGFIILLMGIGCFIGGYAQGGFVYCIFFLLGLVYILYPYGERYCIIGHEIHIKRHKRHSIIVIPDSVVVVVSKADVHALFGHQSILLKKKYAVTYLDTSGSEEVFDALFGKDASQFQYTNSSIENMLGQQFVYSFVIEKAELLEVLERIDGPVIIPFTLLEQDRIERVPQNVLVDKRC